MTVFISHSSRDASFVEQELIPLLSQHDVPYWYSTEHIATAEEWQSRIVEGLKEASAFIVVLSPAAVRSVWVRREVDWAVRHRLSPLAPIVLARCNASLLNTRLGDFQHLYYRAALVRSRRQLLATLGKTLNRSFRPLPVSSVLALLVTGAYWRRGTIFRSVFATLAAVAALFAAIVATAQDPELTGLTNGVPVSLCAAERYGSAIQIFEHGWLVARFRDGVFYAVTETGDGGVSWRRYPDTYKSGKGSPCQGVERAELLAAGFRKLYCHDAPQLAKELGAPRTPETKAYVQFQSWSGGLLIVGLPATAIGFEGAEHKFTRMAAAFLAPSALAHGGGSITSWTEGTLSSPDNCSANWYRLVGGYESPLLGDRCGAMAVHAASFVKPRFACTR